jgi:hypothetical protein
VALIEVGHVHSIADIWNTTLTSRSSIGCRTATTAALGDFPISGRNVDGAKAKKNRDISPVFLQDNLR